MNAQTSARLLPAAFLLSIPLGGAAAALQQAPMHLDAIDVFAAARHAASIGRIDEALGLYDALTHDPNSDIRSEARFRKGQLLAAQHRDREAAVTYRRLLDEKPDAARVRIELAALLARMGDETAAQRQLRLAQAGTLPPEVAAQLVQFSHALRSPKRFGGTIDLALAPDSNVNRGTQARTLETVIAPLVLSDEARATSGIGVRLRPSGFAKQPVSDRVSIVLRGALSADLYRRGNANDVVATLLGGVEWQNPHDRVDISYGGNRRWYGGPIYADSRSATAEWLHQIGHTTQLSSTISRTGIRYRTNPLQDGALYDFNISVEHAFSPRIGAALGGDVARQDALDRSYANWAGGPLAYGWIDIGRITAFGTINARRLVGDERNFLFTSKRLEWFTAGRVGVSFRKLTFHTFTPLVRVGVERNASSVSIYDYRRVYGEVGLSRTF